MSLFEEGVGSAVQAHWQTEGVNLTVALNWLKTFVAGSLLAVV